MCKVRVNVSARMTGRSSIYLFLIVVLIVSHVRASCLFRTCCTTADTQPPQQPQSNNEPSRIRKALQTLNQLRTGGRVATGRSAPKTNSWENLVAEQINVPIEDDEMVPIFEASPLAESWIHRVKNEMVTTAVFRGELQSPPARRTYFTVGQRAFFNKFYVFGFGIKHHGIFLNSMFQESFIYLDANMMSIFKNTSFGNSQLAECLKQIEHEIQLSREYNSYKLAYDKIKAMTDFSMSVYLNEAGRMFVDSHLNIAERTAIMEFRNSEAGIQVFYFPFGEGEGSRRQQLSVTFLESLHATDDYTNGMICLVSSRVPARMDVLTRTLQRAAHCLKDEEEEKWFDEISGKIQAGELVVCGKIEPKVE